jgi:hypothetical protein
LKDTRTEDHDEVTEERDDWDDVLQKEEFLLIAQVE